MSNIPNTLKLFSKRLARLKQEVAEMKHYWKIRCRERKIMVYKNRKLTLLLSRMQHLEKTLGALLNRKHFTIRSFKDHKNKINDQCYPLFISHNECVRLRSFLGKPIRTKKEV